MSQTKEMYRPQPIAAGGLYKVGGSHLAGFLAAVAGTITITDADGTVLVNAAPVVTGIFIRIPLAFNTSMGGTVQLGGGAAGTLFI